MHYVCIGDTKDCVGGGRGEVKEHPGLLKHPGILEDLSVEERQTMRWSLEVLGSFC